MKWNGFDTDPTLFQPVSAKEIKDDGTVLDVAAWREDTTQKLIDIRDEVNDEQAATRQTIIDEHTSTRATIESVGEEIEAVIISKSDEEQVKLDAIQTEINDEALAGRDNETAEHTSTRATITTKSDEEQVILNSLDARGLSQEQSRNGQTHQRVYDPEATDLLKQILSELKQLNTHLYTITELDVKSWDS